MPQSTDYTSIMSLISSPRINSYRVTFRTSGDAELYGIYVWAQHASASLYPLTQNLEIALRNAIDQEARRRFGSFWWKRIGHSVNHQSHFFMSNIQKAEGKLSRDWEKIIRAQLRLPARAPISIPTPVWTHDQIVAATDFSTWQFILVDAFNASTPANHPGYLWPVSLSRVFKNYAIINSNQSGVRKNIIDLVKELRDYRNRLFHHEPLWTKGPAVVDARTAIDTIRRKINKIELLLNAIDSRQLSILSKVGLLRHARRVCSEEELSIYRYNHVEGAMTQRKKRVLRSMTTYVNHKNVTTAWAYGGSLYGIYKIR